MVFDNSPAAPLDRLATKHRIPDLACCTRSSEGHRFIKRHRPPFTHCGIPAGAPQHFPELLHGLLIIRRLPGEMEGIVCPLPDRLGRPQ
jgi:hypothetical protein